MVKNNRILKLKESFPAKAENLFYSILDRWLDSWSWMPLMNNEEYTFCFLWSYLATILGGFAVNSLSLIYGEATVSLEEKNLFEFTAVE